MKDLLSIDQKQTMSSLHFRVIVNEARKSAGESAVENSHFLKRVEDELEGELGIRKVYVNPEGGRPAAYYDLTLDQCLLVGMRESKAVRRSVQGKLKEFISYLPQTTQALPKTFSEALQLAADQAKQLEIAAPKIEFFDEYVEADSLHGFREVCKLLNANERDFRQFLVDSKIVYRLGGAWTAYKPHIEAGRMDTKAATANGKTFNQIMFTAKGVTWVAEKWGEFNK